MGSNTANIPTANGGNSIGLKMLAIQLELYAGCPSGYEQAREQMRLGRMARELKERA